MSVASRLIAAIRPLGYPISQNQYIGEQPVYFVFNLSAFPADFADDEPQHERVMVQLHLFAPHTTNTTMLQKEVKAAIRDAGFQYPVLENASDEDNQHLVFESEISTEAV